MTAPSIISYNAINVPQVYAFTDIQHDFKTASSSRWLIDRLIINPKSMLAVIKGSMICLLFVFRRKRHLVVESFTGLMDKTVECCWDTCYGRAWLGRLPFAGLQQVFRFSLDPYGHGSGWSAETQAKRARLISMGSSSLKVQSTILVKGFDMRSTAKGKGSLFK